MGLALQKSTDSGTTFQQASLSVADYTLSDGSIANTFYSVKDSKNNCYITCYGTGNGAYAKIIRISETGVKAVANFGNSYYSKPKPVSKTPIMLSRDENTLFIVDGGSTTVWTIPTNFIGGVVQDSNFQSACQWYTANSAATIYKDQYIWVASGTTVKIYDYTTKAELASVSVPTTTLFGICCDAYNNYYSIRRNTTTQFVLQKCIFNSISTITTTDVVLFGVESNVWLNTKQLLIDRFGDLNILTNTGTASTLLKYSNTGTLIDTVNLSVGTNKGAYGLQVYSSDNGTKCWVQFSNDLGTWRTAETTAQGQVFGAVSKLRDNGVTVYGSDMGGDNNYSVRC